MINLENKVAVITGAASGIGLAGVEVFVAAGAKVVAADLQDEKGKMLETRFGSDTVSYKPCDVTDADQLSELMEHAASTFGGIDILWNNAGSGGWPGGVEEYDRGGFDQTVSLLLRSVFEGTHYALPHMIKRGGGSVINTSSISAVCAGYAPIIYSVCKKGVAHFSKLAAAELSAHNIRVNSILPGFIATSIFGASLGLGREQADQMAALVEQQGGSMQPAGRTGRGEDIANMAAFLASDASEFITGSEFLVDGGMTVGPPHSWRETDGGPLLDALGITPEQAEQMSEAMKAQQAGT